MGDWFEIKRNVIALGVVSFFTDVSSEMIFPILPVFLSVYLGASKEAIGLIEGIADSLSSLLDIFVGYFSDSSRSRKEIVLAGYGFSSISKIGIAFASTWPIVLVFRGLDRVGKSIRTSPRDSIIADSVGKSQRGKSFGLHRAMDTAGAVTGPVLAYIILSYFGSGENAYRNVFFAAIVPAFIAIAAIVLLVREPARKTAKASKKEPFFKSLGMLSQGYKDFLKISCVFSLSYFSFALLILRANELGIGAQDILLVYILYNIVYMASSVPAGILSDRIGRKLVISGAFIVYALVLAGFALATNLLQIAILFAVYGAFVAADDSVNKAYVADIEPERKGIALGTYNTAVGAAYLPASVAFGFLWATLGAGFAFGIAALLAAASGVLMLIFIK